MKKQNMKGPGVPGPRGMGTPVSYTHLDVYKRQLVYLTVEIRNLGSSSCSGGSGLGINDNGIRINEAFL